LAEVVSGHKSVSTPAYLNKDLHNKLWLLEEQAAQELAENNVEYVLITTKNFNLVQREDGNLYYALSGGLIFEPERIPHVAISSYTTVYKLRQNQTNPQYFKLVWGKIDEKTGFDVFLYKVFKPKSIKNNASIGVLYKTSPGVRNASLDLLYKLEDGSLESHSMFEEFPEGTYSRVYWLPTKSITNCGFSVNPINESWGYEGQATFRNTGSAKNATLQIYLVDSRKKDERGRPVIVGMKERSVYIKQGESVTIPYLLNKPELLGEYFIAFNQQPGIEVVESETSEPVYKGANVLHVFC
jgi:hypothetical protein